MSDGSIRYELKDRVAWLTIDREERRNALDAEAIAGLGDGLRRAEAEDDVRVVCLTGAGDKAFCSGADLAASLGQPDAIDTMRAYAELLKQLHGLGKPCVARVAGHAMGGGIGLLLSCDVAYAREGVKLGTPELAVGIFPMMIGALIFRNLRRKKALEMIYTGRSLDAREAEEIGLITRAVPASEFETVVQTTLAAIATKAPLAMRLGRQAFAEAEGLPLGPALDFLCERLAAVVSTEDAREGLRAFLEKRPPVWTNR
jgi:enoyl-CoA hydratase/carnithine racemase